MIKDNLKKFKESMINILNEIGNLNMNQKKIEGDNFDIVLYNDYLISYFSLFYDEDCLSKDWLNLQAKISIYQDKEIEFYKNRDTYLILFLKQKFVRSDLNIMSIISNPSVCRKQIILVENEMPSREELKEISFFPVIPKDFDRNIFKNFVLNEIKNRGYSKKVIDHLLSFQPGQKRMIENFFKGEYEA